mmetsp:Transcript_14954/g.43963  ORF Transcript_14954/g.43963 Transcript_14954/m.43963 type:complete len:128 (-) Transcript_14954:122-505(-)
MHVHEPPRRAHTYLELGHVQFAGCAGGMHWRRKHGVAPCADMQVYTYMYVIFCLHAPLPACMHACDTRCRISLRLPACLSSNARSVFVDCMHAADKYSSQLTFLHARGRKRQTGSVQGPKGFFTWMS